MRSDIRALEKAAIDGFAAGKTWLDFWQEHGPAIARAEPYSHKRYKALQMRLLALLVSGEDVPRVVEPDEPAPWFAGDRADVGTAARLQVRLPPT